MEERIKKLRDLTRDEAKRTIVLLVIVAAMSPTPAYACSGFVDCLFGFTARTEVRAGRDVELERIQAERDREVANVEALAAERVKQAEATVEQVRQQRYETEAARDIAIAQAQAQAEEYKAMVQALSGEKVAEIDAAARTQIVALQEAGKIHVEGITQTGRTERSRIIGGWAFAIIALLVIGGLLRLLAVRQREHIEYVRMVTDQRRRQIPGQRPAYIETGDRP